MPAAMALLPSPVATLKSNAPAHSHSRSRQNRPSPRPPAARARGEIHRRPSQPDARPRNHRSRLHRRRNPARRLHRPPCPSRPHIDRRPRRRHRPRIPPPCKRRHARRNRAAYQRSARPRSPIRLGRCRSLLRHAASPTNRGQSGGRRARIARRRIRHRRRARSRSLGRTPGGPARRIAPPHPRIRAALVLHAAFRHGH